MRQFDEIARELCIAGHQGLGFAMDCLFDTILLGAAHVLPNGLIVQHVGVAGDQTEDSNRHFVAPSHGTAHREPLCERWAALAQPLGAPELEDRS